MTFHYRKLADEIEIKIGDGAIKAGEKLPSLRTQRARTGLSVTTVYQAYMELETRGVVEAREKSGFFVRPRFHDLLPLPNAQPNLARPRKVAVNMLVEVIHSCIGDPHLLQLGAAIPSPELLPVRRLHAAARAMAGRYLKEGGIGYGQVEGVAELRRQLANRMVGSLGAAVDQEEIIVTNGCMDAIQLCLRAVAGPGDTVLVESPTFTCYLQLIEDLNMLALELPTDPERGIDYAAVRKAVTEMDVKACILNTNFQNPLGFEMADEDKRQLVQFLTGRGIPIIEDDIYGDLTFGPSRPSTLNLKTAVALQLGAGSNRVMGGRQSKKSRNACRVMSFMRAATGNCSAASFSRVRNPLST